MTSLIQFMRLRGKTIRDIAVDLGERPNKTVYEDAFVCCLMMERRREGLKTMKGNTHNGT